MKLTIVGCSGSMSGRESAASAYLLEAVGVDQNGLARTYSVFLDFGPGAMGQSLKYVDPALLDGIIFSHLHADHCADLVGMQVYRRWHPLGALSRIPVLSPADGKRRLLQLSDDPLTEDYAGEFEFLTVKAGDTANLGPLRFEFFAAVHTVPALAVRVTGPSSVAAEKEVVFAYSGDTDTCPGLVDAARGADLFLCEAAFEQQRDQVRGVHLTGLRAGQVAQEAGAAQLVLTHLQPWTDRELTEKDARKNFAGEVSLACPGAVYEI